MIYIFNVRNVIFYKDTTSVNGGVMHRFKELANEPIWFVENYPEVGLRHWMQSANFGNYKQQASQADVEYPVRQLIRQFKLRNADVLFSFVHKTKHFTYGDLANTVGWREEDILPETGLLEHIIFLEQSENPILDVSEFVFVTDLYKHAGLSLGMQVVSRADFFNPELQSK